jgi:hypothetical protein
MKLVSLLCCLLIASCAQKPTVTPKASSTVARASMAKGKITAEAVKTITDQDVCIVITLQTKGVSQEAVLSSNWMAAVVDQKSQYHLLSINQRDPASVPQGKRKNWTFALRTCASRVRLGDVKKLVLTPKVLPFNNEEELQLIWD